MLIDEGHFGVIVFQLSVYARADELRLGWDQHDLSTPMQDQHHQRKHSLTFSFTLGRTVLSVAPLMCFLHLLHGLLFPHELCSCNSTNCWVATRAYITAPLR